MHEDILELKRISIMYDIIEREGFEFSTAQMHSILGEERHRLSQDINSLHEKYASASEYYGFKALYWGCCTNEGGVYSSRVFANQVHEYYHYIGDMEYYRGLSNA